MTVTENAAPNTVSSTVSSSAPSNDPDTNTDTVPHPDDALIGDFRAGIDALDGRIIALVQERMALSATAQQARRGPGPGSRRISLSREMEILTHYRDALGRPGTALAMTLLELCRGPRPVSGPPREPSGPQAGSGAPGQV